MLTNYFYQGYFPSAIILSAILLLASLLLNGSVLVKRFKPFVEDRLKEIARSGPKPHERLVGVTQERSEYPGHLHADDGKQKQPDAKDRPHPFPTMLFQ